MGLPPVMAEAAGPGASQEVPALLSFAVEEVAEQLTLMDAVSRGGRGGGEPETPWGGAWHKVCCMEEVVGVPGGEGVSFPSLEFSLGLPEGCVLLLQSGF